MTAPWPPPSPRPVSRPPSLVLVVLGVVLAMLAQLGSALALQASTVQWQARLLPAPVPTSSSPAVPQESSRPTPTPSATDSPRAVPEQSVGPVQATDELKRGVVLITGRTPAEGVAGTGMVLTDDGYVLTNYHVVRSTESVTVTLASTGRRYTAELVGRDATKDVALLRLERATNLRPVSIDTDEVAVGDVVVAAGNANGQGFVTANRGNIQALDQSINVKGASANDPPQRLRGLIETNAPAWPGDSGGPMYDAEGEVLGMTSAGSTEDEETKQVYAVPIRVALDVVEQILDDDESGTVVIGPKAYLGIIAEVDDTSAVRIASVQDDTPAAGVGLRGGDTITALDGQRVRTRAELSDVLDTIEPDSTVEIAWTTASGERRTADITVTENPLN